MILFLKLKQIEEIILDLSISGKTGLGIKEAIGLIEKNYQDFIVVMG